MPLLPQLVAQLVPFESTLETLGLAAALVQALLDDGRARGLVVEPDASSFAILAEIETSSPEWPPPADAVAAVVPLAMQAAAEL